ncbi:hypothetical protein [Actinoplanes sp. NPDC023714]|uniref:hypothetical protein n=1 Tax=Actinoplanes sp. NPDC023714 TaxID=3154322 RepID=UPI0033E193A8
MTARSAARELSRAHVRLHGTASAAQVAGLAMTGLILLIGPMRHRRDLPDQPGK